MERRITAGMLPPFAPGHGPREHRIEISIVESGTVRLAADGRHLATLEPAGAGYSERVARMTSEAVADLIRDALRGAR